MGDSRSALNTRVGCSYLLIAVPQVYADNAMAGAKLMAVDELQDVFEGAGVDVQAPLVCR